MSTFPNIIRKEKKSSLDCIKTGTLFNSIEYQIADIVKKIENIENLNPDEIRDIIMRQHSMILNYDLFLQDPITRSQAISLFTNKNFLNIFLSVVRTLDLTQHEIICINKLAYDYYVLSDKDLEVSDLLYNITTEVNTNKVMALSGIVGLQMAKILVMIRNSTFIESKAVQRVNNFIIKCDAYMTSQTIISIYCNLFPRITNLVIYTMLETKPNNLNEEQNKKFDNISLAILALLDFLNSNDIKKILCDYSFTLYKANNQIVRFSLRSAKGYHRIIKAIRELEISDGIIIP